MNPYQTERRGPAFYAALTLLAQDDPPVDPEAQRRREELDELTRRACLSALERARRSTDPDLLDRDYLEWAADFVATHPPLGRPLGTGNPDGT